MNRHILLTLLVLTYSKMWDKPKKVNEKINNLIESSKRNSSEALNSLGEIYLIGKYGAEVNYTLAGDYFKKAAYFKNADAFYNMAFMGKHGFIKNIDPEEELMFLTMASNLGSDKAKMALSNKYSFGYGVINSCQKSTKELILVAKKVKENFDPEIETIKDFPLLSNQKTNAIIDNDSLSYIKNMADSGHQTFMFKYAKILLKRANAEILVEVENAEQIAYKILTELHENGHSEATYILGVLNLRGIGTKTDFPKAHSLFKTAAQMGFDKSHDRLAEIYRKNLPIDPTKRGKAETQSRISALRNNSEGIYQMSKIFKNKMEFSKSRDKLLFASQLGYPLAIFDLAQSISKLNEISSCAAVKILFKRFVTLRKSAKEGFKEAYRSFLNGEYHQSLLLYMDLAYQGEQKAQINAAFILKRRMNSLRKQSDKSQTKAESFYFPISKEIAENRSEVKLYNLFENPFCNSEYYYLSLASDQNDVVSKRDLGDFHLAHGDEITEKLLFSHQRYYLMKAFVKNRKFSRSEMRFLVALELYREGSFKGDAQSTFNIAYMYQFGIGIPQNLDLSRIAYEKALKQSKKAKFLIYANLLLMELQTLKGKSLTDFIPIVNLTQFPYNLYQFLLNFEDFFLAFLVAIATVILIKMFVFRRIV